MLKSGIAMSRPGTPGLGNLGSRCPLAGTPGLWKTTRIRTRGFSPLAENARIRSNCAPQKRIKTDGANPPVVSSHGRVCNIAFLGTPVFGSMCPYCILVGTPGLGSMMQIRTRGFSTWVLLPRYRKCVRNTAITSEKESNTDGASPSVPSLGIWVCKVSLWEHRFLALWACDVPVWEHQASGARRESEPTFFSRRGLFVCAAKSQQAALAAPE